MNELIEKWCEFMVAWSSDTKNYKEYADAWGVMEKYMVKPAFYDFMEWWTYNKSLGDKPSE